MPLYSRSGHILVQRPGGVAFDGANIWVTNQSGNNVSKL
jgi:hypothetical protein